jgi:hypothetical protein
VGQRKRRDRRKPKPEEPKLDPLVIVIVAGFHDLATITGKNVRFRLGDVMDIVRDIRQRERQREIESN